MVKVLIHHDEGVRTVSDDSDVNEVIDLEASDAVRVYYENGNYDDYYHATITTIFFE